MPRTLTRALTAALICAGLGFGGTFALTSGQTRPAFQDLWLHETGKPGLTRLTSASEPGRISAAASVSADGGRIVFHSDSDFLRQGMPRGTPEIWLYEVAAMRFTRVTTASDPQRRSLYPSISADGSTVVFESDSDLLNDGLPRGQREVWRYSVAGHVLTRVTRGALGSMSGAPVTNATGTIVALHSNATLDGTGAPGPSTHVWLFDASRNVFTRVTEASSDGRRSRNPAISADASRIAFESDADFQGEAVPQGQTEIWLFDVATKRLKKVTTASDISRASEAPSLSADGSKLVFHGDADLLNEGLPDAVDEIWLYDVTTAATRRVTSSWVPARDAGANAVLHPDCQYPRITADGRRVVFSSDADFLAEGVPSGYPHAWVYDLTTDKVTRVDTAAGSGSGVAINADASRVVLYRTDFDSIRAARVAPGSAAAGAASIPSFPPGPRAARPAR